MEHIKNIEIQNFKSIRHCKINDCKRINVFVGAPNVGKSNILEGMGLCSLKEGNSRSQHLEDYVRFEKLSSLFYKKNIDNQFEIYFNDDFAVLGSFEGNRNRLSINYFDSIEHIKLKEPNYIISSSEGKGNPENRIEIFSNMGFGKNHKELKTGNIKKYKFKENTELADYNSNELHIPNGENIGTFLAYQNGELFQAIQNLVAPNSFEIESNGNLRYKKTSENGFPISFSYNEIADTLQRLIFHLTAIMSNKNSVLLFEEPEAHCYEPYVLDMTNAIKFDNNNNQYFIVTHSDYLVQEFLRDENSRNETNIYMVGLDSDGSTKVKLLDREISDDVYEFGTNVFFNYDSLWKENNVL